MLPRMEASDAFRAIRPRLHAAAAESAYLTLLEAQTAGASGHERARIAEAYARAWRELSEWLDARDAGKTTLDLP